MWYNCFWVTNVINSLPCLLLSFTVSVHQTILHCTTVHSCIKYITNPLPDLPKVSLVEKHLLIERRNNITVTVQFVIVGSNNQTAKSDFEMELTETGTYVCAASINMSAW